MHPTDTLERIATLLPADQRERFFATVARFRDIPADDEYLMVLEAIGFMTLIWSEVPNQIREVLAGSHPHSASHESTDYLVDQIENRLNAAVQVPSYADLRELVDELKSQQRDFSGAAQRLTAALAKTSGTPKTSATYAWLVLAIVLAGVALLLQFQIVL